MQGTARNTAAASLHDTLAGFSGVEDLDTNPLAHP